ncbi:DegV family protein [Deinococcus cavernae]|uniref:DegV family protein n=1 Tax=Deinococcus cavernae TaxID=2320857 RepID=A0A418V4R4_9DEIO|nr:DegV family protein [Deinococcus cavernae]RJF71088.1 DegV family protein [Deinococcus cavernae]
MTVPQFAVVTDGGLDAYTGLKNNVPVAPFSVIFGSESFRTHDIARTELYRRLEAGGPHPTSAQPTPQDWLQAYEQTAQRNVLALTISSGLSGSLNSAEQSRRLFPGKLTIHDSRTLSAAQAFQVHAAQTAAERGESLETALRWVRQVADETELYFTIDTLEYLRRGGRIGRVAATLGGLLNLKPVIHVDKTTGTYENVGRARSYRAAIEAVVAQITRKYGEGTPLRVGFLYGNIQQDADVARELVAAHHPILWDGQAPVNPVLNIHTGPRALGIAAAPGPWPWEK